MTDPGQGVTIQADRFMGTWLGKSGHTILSQGSSGQADWFGEIGTEELGCRGQLGPGQVDRARSLGDRSICGGVRRRGSGGSVRGYRSGFIFGVPDIKRICQHRFAGLHPNRMRRIRWYNGDDVKLDSVHPVGVQ